MSLVSDCCNAASIENSEDYGICVKCGEHCDYVDDDPPLPNNARLNEVHITGGFSGTIGIGDYSNRSPFFSRNETIVGCELTEEEITERQFKLSLQCFDLFEGWKEEITRKKSVLLEPVCSSPQMEKIRLQAIELIKEQSQWFKENSESGVVLVLFEMVTRDKLETKNQIDRLMFFQARRLNLQLGAWKDRIDKKQKGEKSENKKTSEATKTS